VGLSAAAIELSDRALREAVLFPWRAAITKDGVLGVIAGYPEIEDIPAHGFENWMNGIRRQELGFEGIV
jgi:beta-glucosidase-like glycosyl hydrolase